MAFWPYKFAHLLHRYTALLRKRRTKREEVEWQEITKRLKEVHLLDLDHSDLLPCFLLDRIRGELDQHKVRYKGAPGCRGRPTAKGLETPPSPQADLQPPQTCGPACGRAGVRR
jgi:hypothetical protein